MNYRRASRIILMFCAVAVMFAAPWWWHAMEAKNLRVRAGWLHVGDPSERVMQLLGRPSRVRQADGESATWVYQTTAQDLGSDARLWVRQHIWSGLDASPGDPPIVVYLDSGSRVERVVGGNR